MSEIFKETKKCPACKSEKRVLGPLFQELVKNKPKHIQAQAPQGLVLQAPLQFAMNALMTKCPLLSVTIDVCADCHCVYAVAGDLMDAPVQVQMNSAAPPLPAGGQGFAFNRG